MTDRCCQSLLSNEPQDHLRGSDLGAPGGIRTPNLLIRRRTRTVFCVAQHAVFRLFRRQPYVGTHQCPLIG
jgi:hypothetical protein